MGQSQTGIQTEKMVQTATLTPQQILLVKLLELTTVEMEVRARDEISENPALERGREEGDSDDYQEKSLTSEPTEDGGDGSYDPEGDYRSTDDIPEYKLRERNYSPDEQSEEIPISDSVSFYDILLEQLGECDLTEREEDLGKYLIGSLENDGLLHRPLYSIADELVIQKGIETTTEELEQVLKILQGFEPAGIGARSTQECLLLQIRRKKETKHSEWLELGEKILTDYADDFLKKNWENILRELSLTAEEGQRAFAELARLNPKPGASLGETIGRNTQQIIPDFLVETDDEGGITLTLNSRNVPELRMNPDFRLLLEEEMKKGKQSKKPKDTLVFLKHQMDKAQTFIDAVKQRQNTLTKTMQTIIDLQRPFFVEGDEALLKPMILQDVADRTGLDISTISRVNNSKYVQTNYGIFPLKFFFSDGYVTKDGNELSVRAIRQALKKCVDEEDKKNPLTDQALTEALKEMGYPIARRTVAKYREMEHIPSARLRKTV